MLHITNGSSVSLADTGLGGEIVCWADALHEGPVPADLDLAELTRLRIAFLSSNWPEVAPILQERDAALQRFGEHDEVALWFEHDLYDQLQLIQILVGFMVATRRRRV
ncbi:ECF subfamily RNA polymerase sigma-24 factor (fragment) [Candidatus Sulfopaludibacter sp. SbA3]